MHANWMQFDIIEDMQVDELMISHMFMQWISYFIAFFLVYQLVTVLLGRWMDGLIDFQ